MVDLSVNFAGVELKNPLVVASSDNVRDIRQIKKAEEHGASAIILKAILPLIRLSYNRFYAFLSTQMGKQCTVQQGLAD
jgi:dihydroorotate dehydrogenase